MNNHHRTNERGSVIFFIFLGIALFGALSYAFTHSMNTSSNPERLAEDKLSLHATEVLNYGRTIKLAIKDMRISYGCDDTDISFANNFSSDYDHSPAAPEDCQVFNTNGGGLTWSNPPENISDSDAYIFSGRLTITDIGTTDPELTMILPNVSELFCNVINEMLDLDEPQDDAFNAAILNNHFTGIYTNLGSIGTTGTGHAMYDGVHAGCVYNDQAGVEDYVFYQVLLAR